MRIVIGEDSALIQEGLARLLIDAGHGVVARVADAEAMTRAVEVHAPDLLIADIRRLRVPAQGPGPRRR